MFPEYELDYFWPTVAMAMLMVAVWFAWRSSIWKKDASRMIEAFESLPIHHYALWGNDDRLVLANKAYRQLHAEGLQAVGPQCSYEELVRFELSRKFEGPVLEANVKSRLAKQKTGDGEATDVEYGDGRSLSLSKYKLSDGSTSTVALDITELRQRESELESAYAAGNLGTWRLEANGQLLIRGKLQAMHGLEPQTDVGSLEMLWQNLDDATTKRLFGDISYVRSTGQSRKVKYQIATANGSIKHLKLYLEREDYQVNGMFALSAVIHDITDTQLHHERLHQLAYFDPLTGLANRALFKHEIVRQLRRTSSTSFDAALLLIDLDHFKGVNDTLGHEAGDQLLARLSERMMSCLRPSDFLARIGGDEFAIFLSRMGDRKELIAITDRLQAKVSQPLDIIGGIVQPSISIGIACVPDDGRELDTLMRNADLALFAAKEAGRARHSFFDPEMFDETRRKMDLSNALRAAISNDELHLVFQPQVSLKTGRVIGLEALLRWQSAVFGFVPPSDFIPIAESSSLIGEIGSWVLHEACKKLAELDKYGFDDLYVSVNVSAVQFMQLDMRQEIASATSSAGLTHSRLCVELTESLFLDRDRARAKLGVDAIDALGTRLSIDDFGTGYSSLSYLRDLPFDELKIDRAFIVDCETDESRKVLLSGIVQLGHGLAMSIVAEGVENAEQVEVLKSLKCDIAQGYYFARPCRFEDVPGAIASIHGETEERSLKMPPVEPGFVTAPTKVAG